MRTYLVEFRQSIEHRKLERVANFARQCAHRLKSYFERIPELEGELELDAKDIQQIEDLMVQLYAANFGEVSAALTPTDMTVLTKAIQAISQIAERAKKIEDGITLKLEWSKDLAEKLGKFIVQVVFPHIPVERRMDIAADARKFFSSTVGNQMALTAVQDA